MGCIWYAGRNAAKENNLDPIVWTKTSDNERTAKGLGLSIDWDREISADLKIL